MMPGTGNKKIGWLFFLVLTGCFGGPGFLNQNAPYKVQDASVKVSIEGEKTNATIAANSVVTQTLTAPPTSSIAGVKVAVQPGTFAFDVPVTLEESAPLATGVMANSLGVTLSSTAGKAVNISAQGVSTSELAKPMTISIPVITAALRLTTADQVLVIVYRTIKDGVVFDGIIPNSKLKMSGGEVVFDILRWGSYQPAYIPVVEKDKAEVVVEKKTEEKIITVTEIKALPQATISAINIDYQKDKRRVIFTATLTNATAKTCYLEAYDIVGGERHYEETGDKLYYDADFSEDGERIYAKVKLGCVLTTGLVLETAYGVIDVPADPTISSQGPTNTDGSSTGGTSTPPSGGGTTCGDWSQPCGPNITNATVSGTGLDFSNAADLSLDLTVEVTLESGFSMDINDADSSCWMFYSPNYSTPIGACGSVTDMGGGKYSRTLTVNRYVKNANYYLWQFYWMDGTGKLHEVHAGDPMVVTPPPTFMGTAVPLPYFTVSNADQDLSPPDVADVYVVASELKFDLTGSDAGPAPMTDGMICAEFQSTTDQQIYYDCTVGPLDFYPSVTYRAFFSDFTGISSGTYDLIRIEIMDPAGNMFVIMGNPGDAYYKDWNGNTTTIDFLPTITIP